MDRILLFDFENNLWRANISFKPKPKTENDPYAFPNQEQPPEQYVIPYNFLRNIRVLIEQFEPVKAIFVLDGHPQFRYDLYADYKANRIVKTATTKTEQARAKSQAKVDAARPIVLSLLKHLPITLAKAEHYEADDTISTLTKDLSNEDVVVLTNDTDYIQLLQKGYKNVRVYSPNKKSYFECPPYSEVARKALNGDTSDNIKGLVGEKKALTLAQSPEALKAFLAIEENRANFSINLQLIEFRDVPLADIQFEEGIANWDELKKEFERMEFKSMLTDSYWNRFKTTFDCLKY